MVNCNEYNKKRFKNKEAYLKCKNSSSRYEINVCNMDDMQFLKMFYDKFSDFFVPAKRIGINNFNVKLVLMFKRFYEEHSQTIDLVWKIKNSIESDDAANVLCLTNVLLQKPISLSKTQVNKSICPSFLVRENFVIDFFISPIAILKFSSLPSL